jgi:hypothetical protein
MDVKGKLKVGDVSSGTTNTFLSVETDGTIAYKSSSITLPSSIELVEELNFNVYLSGELGASIYLDDYAWYDYKVTDITVRTPSGSCVVSIGISGLVITGMSGIAASSNLSIYSASANNTVHIGDSLYIMLDSNADASYLIGSVKIMRV